jgi:hypothetical protein
MENEKYIKTLFKKNTNIQATDDSGKDVIFVVSKGQSELFNIVRDCLLENVSGSCIYCSRDNEVYFTVSKSDMNVLEVISKKIKKDRRIEISKVLINSRKVRSYLEKKEKR